MQRVSEYIEGEIRSLMNWPITDWLDFMEAHPGLIRYLKVAALGDQTLSIAVIPYTIEHTNLGDRKPGDMVNLEFDVLAKYVEKLVAPYMEKIGKGPA